MSKTAQMPPQANVDSCLPVKWQIPWRSFFLFTFPFLHI